MNRISTLHNNNKKEQNQSSDFQAEVYLHWEICVSLCDSEKGCDLSSIECQLLFEDVAYVVKMTCIERMRMAHGMVQQL